MPDIQHAIRGTESKERRRQKDAEAFRASASNILPAWTKPQTPEALDNFLEGKSEFEIEMAQALVTIVRVLGLHDNEVV
jgi:hypothetical protein